MSKHRGMVLLMTLMMTSVIAILILTNMKNLLINIKLVQKVKSTQEKKLPLLQKHQQLFQMIHQYHDNDPTLKQLKSCVFNTDPPYQYPISDLSGHWCQFSKQPNYKYQLWDGGSECCLKVSKKQQAHIYYLRLLKQQKAQKNLINSTIVLAEPLSACHCQKSFVIKSGIISQGVEIFYDRSRKLNY